MNIPEKIAELKAELGKTNLIAVTKYSPVEDVVTAYHASQLDFGENKVQDLKSKSIYFIENKLNMVRWHFIGNLQTNKVKDLLKIPNLYAIHSVNSLKLLNEIIKNQFLVTHNELNIFLQVNSSGENEKSGFENYDDLKSALELLLSQGNKIKFMGLMTMGTIRTDQFEVEAERCFQELIDYKLKLQQEFSLKNIELSMGMSQDYKIALRLGANFVRIGSAIFKN